MVRCGICKGAGKREIRTDRRYPKRTLICINCMGTGRVPYYRCHLCNGVGFKVFPKTGPIPCGKCGGMGAV